MTDPVMLLSQVHGEGRITYRALKEAGYDTLEAVARAEVHVLADQARLSAVTALRLKSGAQHMMGRAPVDGAARSAVPAAAPQTNAHAHREDGAGLADRPEAVRLSDGVLAEEAVLLEAPARRVASPVEAPAPVYSQHPMDPEPGYPPQRERSSGPADPAPPSMPDISAAARAAAEMPHASGETPPSPQTQSERAPHRRSFWSFGGPPR